MKKLKFNANQTAAMGALCFANEMLDELNSNPEKYISIKDVIKLVEKIHNDIIKKYNLPATKK